MPGKLGQRPRPALENGSSSIITNDSILRLAANPQPCLLAGKSNQHRSADVKSSLVYVKPCSANGEQFIAVLSGQVPIKNKTVATGISGGNIDLARFAALTGDME